MTVSTKRSDSRTAGLSKTQTFCTYQVIPNGEFRFELIELELKSKVLILKIMRPNAGDLRPSDIWILPELLS